MRISSAMVAALLAVGCGKGGKGPGTGGDSGTVPIPSIAFGDRANANGLSGQVGANTLLLHKSTNLVLGAAGLAVADEGVRERMQGHSTGARSSHCWTGPAIPQSTFTLDYTNCAPVGIGGGLVFNEDPLGPISLDFKTVSFDTSRWVNGAMGFDAEGAVAAHWTTYDTVATEPVATNRQPITLEVDGQSLTLELDGGAFLRSVNQNLALWGVYRFTPYGGQPAEVLVGGTDPNALMSSSEPAEPASLPWSYLSCRCPTAGLFAMDLDFTVTEVSFDLDDLKQDDDGVDDPDVTVDVSLPTTGPVEYRPVDCGEWEVSYDAADGVEVTLGSDELKAAIQELCDTAVIADGTRCTGLLQAADGVDGVTITVGANRLSNTVAAEASVEFDTSYCVP